MIYLDCETTGLDARKDKVRIVAIDGEAYDIWKPGHKEYVLSWLRGASVEGKTFVAHNAQFDLDFLYSTFPVLEPWKGPIFDTMVASQLMTAGRRLPNSLDAVCQRLLGISLDKTFQKADWSKQWIDDDMLEYAAQDTRILMELVPELNAGLRRTELEGIFKLEMALLPALLNAKRMGVRLDVEAAERLIESLQDEAGSLESKLPYVAGEANLASVGASLFDDADFIQVSERRLNPRAPKDVADYLGTRDATEESIREYINNPYGYNKYDTKTHVDRVEDAKVIRDIKKKYKKASTIRKQLLSRVADDGRIHPSFNQTFVETGRLSARDPNIQQMDQTPDIRGLFIAGGGKKLVVADYSGLELRLTALLSGDENMIQAFRDGRDMHSETCRLIFGEETKRRRTLSKNINFAYSFGGGPGTLIRFAAKQGVEIDEKTAREYHNAFHASYPTLSKWQKKVGTSMKEYVYTVRGRRRYITPGEAYSTRINSPVQGTAADGAKLAMIELYRRGLDVVLSVHDELGIECEEGVSEDVRNTLSHVMVNAMYRACGESPDNPTVPIEVEAHIGNTWAEAK